MSRARLKLNEFEQGLLKILAVYSPYTLTFEQWAMRVVEKDVYEARPYYSDGTYYATYRIEDWGDKWKVRCDRNGYTTQEYRKDAFK